MTSLALYQQCYRDIVIKVCENYIFKDLKNHASDLGPVLVDTCLKWAGIGSGVEPEILAIELLVI